MIDLCGVKTNKQWEFPLVQIHHLLPQKLLLAILTNYLKKKLKKKRIDFVGYRYYDDFSLYFNSELAAQIALTELKSILSEFELRINDDKTTISRTHNKLESDWALAIKSFYFRPSENDQKEDIWNFFSIAFKFSKKTRIKVFFA